MIPAPHAMVTVIAPLPLEHLADAEAELDRHGNPTGDLARELAVLDRDGESGTHFLSCHAFASTDGKSAWLLLEFSADGTSDRAIDRITATETLADAFRRLFVMAGDWKDGADIAAYLKSHVVTTGWGYRDNPGLPFAGTPGMTVGRILAERDLAQRVSELVGAQRDSAASALAQLAQVRAALRAEPEFAAALQPADTEVPFDQATLLSAAAAAAFSAVRAYLWPIAVLVVLWGVIVGVHRAMGAHGWRAAIVPFLHGVGHGLLYGVIVALVATLAGVFVLIALFTAQEARDSTDDRAPDHRVNAAMFARENRASQNHMISITRRKPGLIRALTLRLVFLVIGTFSGRYYRPGFLGDIGTIHFARWVTPPGSRDLVFLSNYDGSWEAYLEDFITLAHQGLTGVWSNTVGFPRTVNLFQQGATDGERFKRFARRSMVPTRLWYSAYPDLTVAVIRRNAAIRRGLSGAMTEDEAKDWLSLFGSVARPVTKLMSSEIQSLVFGGMNFMKFGTCLIIGALPEARAAARQILRDLLPHVAFNDGRLIRDEAVVTLGLGAGGLRRLGLLEEALDTFPFAFIEGMTGEARSRILGDLGDNGPAYWRWGTDAPDLAALIYGVSQEAVDDLVAAIEREAVEAGAAGLHTIGLCELDQDRNEPFGFMDGVSQPVIRGTYKGLRSPDPIHIVEPGEFVLGYPDNRGNLPPGPVLPAIEDPENLLPLVGRVFGFDENRADDQRDLGFNGSFLVIRELEQDVGGFWSYCEDEAERLKGRLPEPYDITAEFIGAKMIGRWPDGSSLVRHPYESMTSLVGRGRSHQTPTMRPRSIPEAPLSHELGAQAGDDGLHPGPLYRTIDPPGALAARGAGNTARDGAAERPRYYGDNDFLFGTEDPEALRCPYGAHIRRANPRDSFTPGSADQIAISNRHRILRVGRRFRPAPGANPGLLFMCLNGDIERQFEFLQQTWLGSPSFHGLSCEKDPILGDAEKGLCGFTIPSRNGPVELSPLPQFVTPRGGGYFFLPGKRLLEYLGRPD
jgi:deferrochelatase/peroxidase EfeB